MVQFNDFQTLVDSEFLTVEQAHAVIDSSQAILCIACAGSGKSQTLAYRISRLISEGVDASSIVAITFTEKAAASLKRRIAAVLTKTGHSPNLLGQMFVGTIHGFCQNVLAESDPVYRQFDVLDGNRFTLYLMSRYTDLGLQLLKPRFNDRYFDTLEQVRNAWNIVQDEGIDIAVVAGKDEQLGYSLAAIRDGLLQDQFIDFSSMVREVAKRAAIVGRVRERLSAIKHLLVDEYQDVSGAQEELVHTVHSLGGNIFVVGDDDQSIYGWRGAHVSNILEFDERYPNVSRHVLATNFRSTRAIVDASNDFISAQLGPERLVKVPREFADGSPRQLSVHHFATREMEAQWVAERIAALLGTAYQKHPNEPVRGLTPADFAILMRSTKSEEQDGKPRHHAFSKAVLERGIDFTLSAGGSVFDRQAVSCLREVFAALERGPVNRDAADGLIASHVRAAFPRVNVKRFYSVLADWGRRIHQPSGGARQRLFPQGLLMDLLEAFDLAGSDFDDDVMRDIGLFSRILQDVESVYFSVDSTYRFRSVVRFLQQSAEKGYDVSTDDVVSRPNAVTISTVHQVKGLEFPVVFVVDAVSGRFPGKQTAFESALPHDLLAAAIGRGAYANSVAAEARLFYTALTRAERYLYVTGAALLPNGKQQRRQSKFAAALKDHEICHDPAQLPSNLLKVRQQQSVDEAILPTSFSDIKYYLNCPMDYRFRKGYGFSPPVPELFGYGRVVHVAIEKLHQAFQERVPSAEEVTTLTSDNFHLKHVAPSGDPVNRPGAYENAKKKAISIAQDYVQRFKADFAQLRQVEVRFEIAARDCIITGSIDLIMRCDANGDLVEAHVVDFKTMEGGENPLENQKLDWRTLSLQVQLYAHATREVYGQRAEMGSIHLLKDNKRISVPIDEASVRSAMENVEWAVRGILEQDFPMRPSPSKCRECDFRRICPQEVQQFRFEGQPPPPISTPLGTAMAAAFDIGDSAVCEVARAC